MGYHFVIGGVARDTAGNAIDGAQVTATATDTGAQITAYFDASLTQPITWPLTADSAGRFHFYTACPSAAGLNQFNLTVSGGAVNYTVVDIEGDTIKCHEDRGTHADGTITANQLDFTLTDVDTAVHEAKNCDVHGIPAAASITYSTGLPGCTATNSPTFATMTATDIIAASTFMQCATVTDGTSNLNNAYTAATAGETLLLECGTHTLTSTLTIAKAIHIRGMGGPDDTIITTNSITASAIDVQPGVGKTVTLENLTLSVSLQTAQALLVTGPGTLVLKNVVITSTGTGTSGITINAAGANAGVFGDNVLLTGSNRHGLHIPATLRGPVHFTNSRIFGNDVAGGSYAQINLAKGGANADGYFFQSCYIGTATDTHGLTLSASTTLYRSEGCVYDGATFAVTAGAGSNPYIPTPSNIINGSTTGTIASSVNTPNYDSGVVTIDNSAGTYDQEFLKQSFTHNLGTRLFSDATLLVSNTLAFTDRVWVVKPQLSQYTDGRGPLGGAFSIQTLNANVMDLILYADFLQAGPGTSTSPDGEFLLGAVKSDAIVASTDVENYDFTAAGGYDLKILYVRLLLWTL